MKPKHSLVLVFAIAFACFPITTASQHPIQLNPDAARFAQQLIEQGNLVADKKGNWRQHQPSAKDENEFIRVHGWADYAKWHLGIDPGHRESSKARYKFPFGDFKNMHRCALIAIRNRAREFGHADIEKAAAELQRKLEEKSYRSSDLAIRRQ